MNVKEEIKEYINQKEHSGALLLTGNWGSGKTYVLKEIANEIKAEEMQTDDLQGKSLIVFVSLFGLNSIEALDQKVKSRVFFALLNTTEEKANRIRVFGNAAAKIAELSEKVSPVVGKIKSAVSINIYDFFDITSESFLKGRKLILIFDDFERTSINIKACIGAINEYVENKGICTIIVADEGKLSDPEYKEFKEKVIYRTLHLSPDIDSIIDRIIESYTETEHGYKQFLSTNHFNIWMTFLESDSNNIRTLKSILIDFERIYKLWISKGYSVDTEQFKSIFYSFSAMAYEIKAGNESLDKISEKYRHYGKYSSNLSALRNWLKYGEWDEDSLIDEIQSKIFPPQITDEFKFLNYSSFDLDSETVVNAVPKILEKAYNGDYSGREMISLLEKISFFNSNHINISDKYDSKLLLDGWIKHEEKVKQGAISEPRSNRFIMPDKVVNMDENEKSVYARLQHLEYKLSGWDTRRTIIDGIESKNVQYNFATSPLYELDDELVTLVISYYKVCSNSERRALANALSEIPVPRISTSDVKSNTIDNLRRFSSFLEELKKETCDPMVLLQINTGIDAINNTLQTK